ncbi:hypothetical protein KQX54_005113 [Cotesia glomerata]|uniref:Uncharacterized protein n=1 Tax=Cotesia glomerata TaxID=32391 RepID=A0AAV7HX86_COTGL|nr:hypothetical protein KQX54_005113 [Cotesia glomerata]
MVDLTSVSIWPKANYLTTMQSRFGGDDKRLRVVCTILAWHVWKSAGHFMQKLAIASRQFGLTVRSSRGIGIDPSPEWRTGRGLNSTTAENINKENNEIREREYEPIYGSRKNGSIRTRLYVQWIVCWQSFFDATTLEIIFVFHISH